MGRNPGLLSGKVERMGKLLSSRLKAVREGFPADLKQHGNNGKMARPAVSQTFSYQDVLVPSFPDKLFHLAHPPATSVEDLFLRSWGTALRLNCIEAYLPFNAYANVLIAALDQLGRPQ